MSKGYYIPMIIIIQVKHYASIEYTQYHVTTIIIFFSKLKPFSDYDVTYAETAHKGQDTRSHQLQITQYKALANGLEDAGGH